MLFLFYLLIVLQPWTFAIFPDCWIQVFFFFFLNFLFAILSLVQSAPGITKGIFGDQRIYHQISWYSTYRRTPGTVERRPRTGYFKLLQSELKYFCLLLHRTRYSNLRLAVFCLLSFVVFVMWGSQIVALALLSITYCYIFKPNAESLDSDTECTLLTICDTWTGCTAG